MEASHEISMIDFPTTTWRSPTEFDVRDRSGSSANPDGD
jgi:hypothetical protein